MKINISQYNPRREKQIIIEISILILINLIRIDPDLDASSMMKKDTMLNNVLRTQMSHKKKGNKIRHHAHAAGDDEPSTKRIQQESDSSSDEEYVLISALTATISHGSNDWLIDSGASKNMT